MDEAAHRLQQSNIHASKSGITFEKYESSQVDGFPQLNGGPSGIWQSKSSQDLHWFRLSGWSLELFLERS